MRRSSPAPVAAAAAAGDGCGGHGGWLGCDDYVCCCPGGGGDGELGQRVSEGVGGCFPQEWLSWQGEWWSAEGVWAWGRCEKKHWRWLPLLLQLRDDCEWKALEMSLPLLWGWLGGQGCRRPRRHASPAGVAAAAAAVAVGTPPPCTCCLHCRLHWSCGWAAHCSDCPPRRACRSLDGEAAAEHGVRACFQTCATAPGTHVKH
eukprot:1159685-Pelagomonas_calceolata.AAC.4